MSHHFKVIPHLTLNKTHLITGSSNIISTENSTVEFLINSNDN